MRSGNYVYAVRLEPNWGCPVVKVGTADDVGKRMESLRKEGYHGLRPAGQAFSLEIPERAKLYAEKQVHKFLSEYLCIGREAFCVPFEIAVSAIKLAVRIAEIAPSDSDMSNVRGLARKHAANPFAGRVPAPARRKTGRPPKRSQPTDETKKRLGHMWSRPDEYERRTVLELASEELGRTVQEWELKHWFGKARRADAGGDE